MTDDPSALSAWLRDSRTWADRVLERYVPPATTHPTRLYEAMRYALFGGGKRIRPALVRLVAESLGAPSEAAERPAAAIELIHTYSLIHDDLPCMDDDDLRRGRATCHVAFDEATAVLAGDALQTLAFEVLAEAPSQAALLTVLLARAAGPAGMVGGQVLDLFGGGDRSPAGFEVSSERAPETPGSLADVHARKTAALFRAAAEMGAVVAGGDADARQRARSYGRALGLCFQAVDDLLDVTGDAQTLGKTPGKDEILDRRTLVATVGFEEGRVRARELAAEARHFAQELGFGAGQPGHELVDFVLGRQS